MKKIKFFQFLKKKRSFEKEIKSIVGFYPDNAFFYHLAFIHKSLVNKDKGSFEESNERLEFLGDAILSAVISEHLFNLFPTMNEGTLSTLRAKIISRNSLNSVGKKLKLKQYIKANVNETAMENSVLGNTLEALVGAIYLDKGYKTTRKFILKKILGPHIKINELRKIESNHKSRVLEWGQKNKKEVIFKLLEETGVGHQKSFSIALVIDGAEITRATAPSKKKAEQACAQQFNQSL